MGAPRLSTSLSRSSRPPFPAMSYLWAKATLLMAITSDETAALPPAPPCFTASLARSLLLFTPAATKTSTKSTSAITRIGTMPIVLLSPPSDWDLPIAGAVVDVGKAGSGDAVVIGRKSVDSSPVGALVGEVV